MRHDSPQYWMFLIPLALVAVGYVIAFTRKGSVVTARLGGRRLELHSPADPATVFHRLAAMDGHFKVDDKDPTANVLVLASPVTFFTWGFLFPVFLHADGNGTRIEIGCHSKLVQIGPIVTRTHRKCADAIEELLSVPSARIA